MSDRPTREPVDSVGPAELPWVPQSEGVAFKLLRVSPETGSWTNLLRVERSGEVSRHRHLGAVQAWVLSGSWRYLEHGWVTRPGDYVYEPPGGVHTLSVLPGAAMETLFVLDGPYEYLDQAGRVMGIESAESKLALYRTYCESNGLRVNSVFG